MPDGTKCPICGGFWFEGECYKCGAYLENGKVVPPKPAGPPEAAPAPVAPVHVPPVSSVRPWDEP